MRGSFSNCCLEKECIVKYLRIVFVIIPPWFYSIGEGNVEGGLELIPAFHNSKNDHAGTLIRDYSGSFSWICIRIVWSWRIERKA